MNECTQMLSGLDLDSGYQARRCRGMPAFVCFKGAPKAERSPTDIQQEKNSIAMHKRYANAFRPLELEQINELKNFDVADRAASVAGRGNADIAQAEDANLQTTREGLRMAGADLTSDKAAMARTDVQGALSDARNQTLVGARKAAQESMDADRIKVMSVGRKKQFNTNAGLRALASSSTQGALDKLKTDSFKREAKMQLIGQAAGSAYGVKSHYDNKALTAKLSDSIPNVITNTNVSKPVGEGLGAYRTNSIFTGAPASNTWQMPNFTGVK